MLYHHDRSKAAEHGMFLSREAGVPYAEVALAFPAIDERVEIEPKGPDCWNIALHGSGSGEKLYLDGEIRLEASSPLKTQVMLVGRFRLPAADGESSGGVERARRVEIGLARIFDDIMTTIDRLAIAKEPCARGVEARSADPVVGGVHPCPDGRTRLYSRSPDAR